jgi:hypothetical protein
MSLCGVCQALHRLSCVGSNGCTGLQVLVYVYWGMSAAGVVKVSVVLEKGEQPVLPHCVSGHTVHASTFQWGRFVTSTLVPSDDPHMRRLQ